MSLVDNLAISPIDRFWRMLKPDSTEIKNVYTYAIFRGLVNLSLPLGIQAIINLIQGGRISTSWLILVILVSAGTALTGVLQIYQLRIVENLQQKIFARAAFEFAYRVPRIKMEELYKRYAPELMNRFFDIISIQKGLSKILIDFTAAILQITFGLTLLSFYHPFFILFSFLLVLLLYLIFKLTAKRGFETSLIESKNKYATVHWLEELARTNTTFKLTGKTPLPMKIIDDNVSRYISSREDHFKILIRQFSLMVGFKVVITLGLLAIGGILVMEQLMNIGQFVAAEIIILLVLSSVETLIKSLETIYDVLTGLEKVGQVTDLELENRQGLDIEVECTSDGMQLEVVDLSFAYPGQKNNIIHDLSFKIERGEFTVVVGQAGSGKSTLMRLIAGLYDNYEGQIIFDDINKESFSAESLRSAIGDFMSQEQLFQGSVLENLTMGKNVSLDRVKEIIKKMHLTGFINSSSKGFDTLLDPQGSGLADSTVQKLLIARSVINEPKLLVLEDNMRSLDEGHKKDIMEYISDKSNKWTTVMTSKDPEILAKADRIIELIDGRIAFNGTQKEYQSRK